ncbi:MAG TPA: DNA primase [Casimicrobiaceae bacterium]|nr:DNA primase [Casimicrobiaceae bacterium]
MIPNDFIDSLLSRVDIVDVIDRSVPLKKAGANYQARCPFHQEKTPSFTVSPTKQFYHCFGCGAHGTAIGFLMDYAGKSFPEAVEALARDVGLEVPRTEQPGQREVREKTQDLTETLLVAARFYRAELKGSARAIDYLKRRGLTGAVAAHFGIGYAPPEWHGLGRVFPQYDDVQLDAAGLVVSGDAGKRYDRFRDRIMFPIHDAHGRVIGFGGRVLDAGEPKYLNSPETPVFSKGRELYGLYLARNAIRAANRIVVVEGYMDVVALAQHGIGYAVATLGTATTPIHAQKLLRLADSVVYCFDGDAAGRKAAWRALENTLGELRDGKEVRFLFLPDGEDPDDFVRSRGKDAFERALATAVPLSQYLLETLAARHSPATPEGRAALVAAAAPYVGQIGAPVLAALVRRQLAELTGLPEAQLGSFVRSAAPDRSARRSGPSPRGAARRPPSLVRELLTGIVLEPALAHRHDLPSADAPGPEAAAWNAVLAYCREARPELTTAGIVQRFAATPHEGVLTEVLAAAADQALPLEQVEVQVVAAAARLRHEAEQRVLNEMLAKPLSALTPGEREALSRMKAPASNPPGQA